MASTTASNNTTAGTRLAQITHHLADTADSTARDSLPDKLPPADGTVSTPTPPVSGPRVILFFGWTAGTTPAIIRFARPYESIFPSARILLFDTTPSDLLPWPFCPTAHLRRGLDELYAAVASLSPADGILVHLLSGGGATRFMALAALYRNETGRTLPIHLLVCDSSPTDSGVVGRARALNETILFPNWSPWVRAMTRPVITFGLAAAQTWAYLTWQPEPGQFNWKGLLNPEYVPNEARRGYVYSAADRVVEYAEVERHIKLAKEHGLEVDAERYEKSPHLAHAKADPKRYWSFISRLWEHTQQANPARNK